MISETSKILSKSGPVALQLLPKPFKEHKENVETFLDIWILYICESENRDIWEGLDIVFFLKFRVPCFDQVLEDVPWERIKIPVNNLHNLEYESHIYQKTQMKFWYSLQAFMFSSRGIYPSTFRLPPLHQTDGNGVGQFRSHRDPNRGKKGLGHHRINYWTNYGHFWDRSYGNLFK